VITGASASDFGVDIVGLCRIADNR